MAVVIVIIVFVVIVVGVAGGIDVVAAVAFVNLIEIGSADVLTGLSYRIANSNSNAPSGSRSAPTSTAAGLEQVVSEIIGDSVPSE